MNPTYEEILIPKKGKNKFRKIVMPSPELKKLQREYLPILEKRFTDISVNNGLYHLDLFHGFLKQKNCVTAAEKHIGYDVTLMMDIKNFFDTVHLNFLPVSYEWPSYLFHKEGYAAQGFVTSPMIANIALIPIVASIIRKLDWSKIKYTFTIYADDIQISFNDIEKAQQIISTVQTEFTNNGYEINVKKTRIREAKYGYRRILGVNVGTDHIRATRKTMKRIRAAKHQVKKSKKVRQSLGGLRTWSKCLRPKNKAYKATSAKTARW